MPRRGTAAPAAVRRLARDASYSFTSAATSRRAPGSGSERSSWLTGSFCCQPPSIKRPFQRKSNARVGPGSWQESRCPARSPLTLPGHPPLLLLSRPLPTRTGLSPLNSLQPHGLYSPWNSSGQNIGVGSLSIFLGLWREKVVSLDFCRGP